MTEPLLVPPSLAEMAEVAWAWRAGALQMAELTHHPLARRREARLAGSRTRLLRPSGAQLVAKAPSLPPPALAATYKAQPLHHARRTKRADCELARPVLNAGSIDDLGELFRGTRRIPSVLVASF